MKKILSIMFFLIQMCTSNGEIQKFFVHSYMFENFLYKNHVTPLSENWKELEQAQGSFSLSHFFETYLWEGFRETKFDVFSRTWRPHAKHIQYSEEALKNFLCNFMRHKLSKVGEDISQVFHDDGAEKTEKEYILPLVDAMNLLDFSQEPYFSQAERDALGQNRKLFEQRTKIRFSKVAFKTDERGVDVAKLLKHILLALGKSFDGRFYKNVQSAPAVHFLVEHDSDKNEVVITAEPSMNFSTAFQKEHGSYAPTPTLLPSRSQSVPEYVAQGFFYAAPFLLLLAFEGVRTAVNLSV